MMVSSTISRTWCSPLEERGDAREQPERVENAGRAGRHVGLLERTEERGTSHMVLPGTRLAIL